MGSLLWGALLGVVVALSAVAFLFDASPPAKEDPSGAAILLRYGAGVPIVEVDLVVPDPETGANRGIMLDRLVAGASVRVPTRPGACRLRLQYVQAGTTCLYETEVDLAAGATCILDVWSDGSVDARVEAALEPGEAPPADPGAIVVRSPGEVTEEGPFVTDVVRIRTYTCELCRSVMRRAAENLGPDADIEMVYESPDAAGCLHDWEPGTSAAHKPPVADGTIVLVRRGQAYGAFVLSNQTTTPERMAYRWWFREDGGGRLDEGAPAVKTGTAAFEVERGAGPPIAFGPFRVEWSGHADGRGWVYYAESPGGSVSGGDTLVCVTDLTDLAGIDAADPRWHYKGTPVD